MKSRKNFHWRFRTFILAAFFVSLAFGIRLPLRAETLPLDDLLARAAHHAEIFLAQFSDVKCNERVQQVKFGKGEKIETTEEALFDYLLMLDASGGDIRLEESRLATAEKSSGRKASLLVTNGFSTLLLIFHPAYQPSFVFDALEEDRLDGAPLLRVHFRHLPGTRSPAVLLVRGREFPLDLEGTAWLDARSGAVVRMKVGLASSLEDIGLRAFRSEVDYAPVNFTSEKNAYWLPRSAVIEVETPRQHWRNTHRFTDYKLFSVSATSSIGQTP